MKVKICGICRPEDAEAAAKAGADYIGVVFARRGPRTQTLRAAHDIFERAGRLARVGVFADQDVEEIVSLAGSLDLDVIQLHGNESGSFAAQVADRTACQVWKAVWLRNRNDFGEFVMQFVPGVDGLVLDTGAGGSGTPFDWTLAAGVRTMRPPDFSLIAAGGLTPGNVQDAIAALAPDIVDVSSGVESAPGSKSRELIERFVQNARS